ncbi:hypothetical protein THAOC_08577, partial [Thalassiosira oceanica]
MGNSASVSEEERVSEEKGSRSGDGRCRELSSGGSSLKTAAISGEAASDSSNRSSPPERGSRSVDGSSRKLSSSSRELSKEGGSSGAPGDTSNHRPPEWAPSPEAGAVGPSWTINDSSCTLAAGGILGCLHTSSLARVSLLKLRSNQRCMRSRPTPPSRRRPLPPQSSRQGIPVDESLRLQGSGRPRRAATATIDVPHPATSSHLPWSIAG